jgi:multiple sugar transport system substrate-binding protein
MKPICFAHYLMGIMLLTAACSPAALGASPTSIQSTAEQRASIPMVTPTYTTATGSPTPDSAPAVSTWDVSGQQGEVSMLVSDEAKQQFESWANDFTQTYSNIVITYVQPPENRSGDSAADYYAQAAQKADIVTIFPDQSELTDAFLDLDPYMQADVAFRKEDFWPGALDGCRDPAGRLLGIPYRIDSLTGIFYDRKVFDEMGLPYPSTSWTLDQFRETLRLLNRPYSFIDQNDFDQSLFGSLIDQNLRAGGGVIRADSIGTQLSGYLDLVNQNLIYPPKDVSPSAEFQDGWNALFTQNHPAMWAGALGSSMPGSNHLYSADDPLAGMAIMEAGFAPFPTGDGLDNTTPVRFTCLAISKNAKKPEAAWKWINFLSEQWGGKETYETFWQLPVRSSAAEASGFWNLLPQQAAPTVRFGLEHGWYGSRYPESFQNLKQAWIQATEAGGDLLRVIRTLEP